LASEDRNRLAAFFTLVLQEPEAAVAELESYGNEPGFKGVMVIAE
jgi:predicted TIM-barrel fold metal-dependent hydrolase